MFNLSINSKRQLLGKWRTTLGHSVWHTEGELSEEPKRLQNCEKRLWDTVYDEAIDRTRSEQRQFSSWKRDELREDSGHLSTSGLNCKEEEINGKKLMHEVVCAYIVLPPYCKRKREKIPYPLLHPFIRPYSKTVQGVWRLSVYLRTILNSFSTTILS